MANPHLDRDNRPWSPRGYGGAQQPAVSFSSQQGGPSDEYFDRPMLGGGNIYPHEASHRREGYDPRHNIGRDRMGEGIMSQPGAYGGDTYNALVGGVNKSQQGGGPQHSGLWQDIKRILNRTKNPGPLIDQWTDHWNEQQAYNVGDTYPLEGGGGGYGARGPLYRTPSNLPELETIPLDMQFDQWGNPIGGDEWGYFDEDFAALSGNGGMNDEMLMAELTQDQKNKMRNQYNAPGLESAPTKQQLFDQIQDMEYKGTLGGYWPGWLGANPPQEPTTWGEFDKEYKHLQDTYWA